ncbi:serine/threonine protein phosphatase [Pseudonocardia xishanensis]|uniref:PPM-type phosphatase domain-containing protein n=1 Tax=Pseudonocardia xishanensis TaxID=630995 RepID=A0ABP8RM72_9PSEU
MSITDQLPRPAAEPSDGSFAEGRVERTLVGAGRPTGRGLAGSASVRGLRRVAADATAVCGSAAAVADGIGDSAGAARAARIAADVAAGAAGRIGPRAAVLVARDAVLGSPDAADTVLVVTAEEPDGDRAVAWVGDCRAYLVTARGVALLSHDHTAAQAFRDAGLDPAPQWEHLVTTTVAHAEAESIGHARVPGAGTLVLVSDGVHRSVEPETLAFLVRRGPTPAAAARALVEAALTAGGTDNATATVLPPP